MSPDAKLYQKTLYNDKSYLYTKKEYNVELMLKQSINTIWTANWSHCHKNVIQTT
jgi:hypothetical protein